MFMVEFWVCEFTRETEKKERERERREERELNCLYYLML